MHRCMSVWSCASIYGCMYACMYVCLVLCADVFSDQFKCEKGNIDKSEKLKL